MHNRPILRVLPAPRPLNAVIEPGGAQAWTAPVGVTQVALPQRGAQADAVACAGGGCAIMRAGGLAAEVTATLAVTAGTVLQVNDGQASTGNPAGSSGSGAPVAGPAGDDGARDSRTPVGSGTYPLADRMLTAGGDGGAGGNADPPRTGRFARDGEATPGDRAGRGASLAERGYVRARFGGVPVLIASELAAKISAVREEQP